MFANTMDGAGDITPQIMWKPDRSKRTKLDELREKINQKYGLELKEYKDFHQWSCDNYPEFWEEVWDFVGVVHSQPYSGIIDRTKNITEVPEWFSDSRLNFAENLLRYNDDRVALYASGEKQNIKQVTFKELQQHVEHYAAAMKKMGVKKGDRVVGYIPNICETVFAMLAAASIGAIWSSTSPDFGVTGVLERFSQIQPKLIFSVNAVVYNGKVHNHLEKLQQVVKGLPDLEKVVVIPFVPESSLNLEDIKNSCLLDEFLSLGTQDTCGPKLEFEQVPFSHPLFIMYSSGTTGAPKCMVHSVGGTLLKHLEEHVVQSNMDRDDVIFYYTTAGWMMWNWLVSSLAVGASVVLYDGSPLIPHVSVLWDLVDKIGITMLGTGAKWLSVLQEKGVKPGKTHSLKSLKMVMSTGSPLKPQSYDYVYSEIKKDLLLASISGGTDIIACFMGQNWTLPVYRGEIQSCHLGCAMSSWGENGKSSIHEGGELVCLKPFPSMPVYFWNDPEGLKYKKAYFSKYPGVWAHGDHCMINPGTGGIIMLGRSDGTLNPNGVRFGSAEIYNVVEAFKEIEDSVCVGQRKKDGTEERVVLFLKMAPGSEFTPEFRTNVKNSIRVALSSRHVPAFILTTTDIPYTISGKKVEIAVRQALMGEEVIQKGALANPNSLNLYYNISELQNF